MGVGRCRPVQSRRYLIANYNTMASKLNPITRMQHWIDSVPGQTFLNYAYSWGASVVILGALFKLTHLPGGNLMLFLGMGTEAFVFFLQAFDRPFDKNSVGKELADDFETDDEIERAEAAATQVQHSAVPGGNAGGGTIVIGGVAAGNLQDAGETPQDAPAAQDVQHPIQQAIDELYNSPEGEASVEQQADKLATIIRLANDELLRRAQAVLSPEMEAATKDYIEKLENLNETLAKVDEQSARLTRDSQEMENLNRTLIGINKVYDLHFASISRQVNTIEDINEQTRQLAAKIEEVNNIYARMMQQLSIMTNPMGAVQQAPRQDATED